MSEQKKVFQIKDVMQITGLSRNTVGKLITTGQLKAVKAGERRWIIPAWALDKFLGQAQ